MTLHYITGSMKTYWLDKNELRKPLGNIMIQATQTSTNTNISQDQEYRIDDHVTENYRTDSGHSRGSDCRSVYSPVTFQDVDYVINSPNRRGIILSVPNSIHRIHIVDRSIFIYLQIQIIVVQVTYLVL